MQIFIVIFVPPENQDFHSAFLLRGRCQGFCWTRPNKTIKRGSFGTVCTSFELAGRELICKSILPFAMVTQEPLKKRRRSALSKIRAGFCNCKDVLKMFLCSLGPVKCSVLLMTVYWVKSLIY